MAKALPAVRIAELLLPFVTVPWSLPLSLSDPEQVLQRIVPPLEIYLDLLLRWNARMNLTAVRTPEEIVQRHFGESLFAALRLPAVVEPGASVLDLGSGAGFPGLPLQLLLPPLRVTLAESQGKKASFLREAVRELALDTEVWARRVEEMAPERCFEVVTLRAVDRMAEVRREAERRIRPGGWLLQLTGGSGQHADGLRIPGSTARWASLEQVHGDAEAPSVPRGTRTS